MSSNGGTDLILLLGRLDEHIRAAHDRQTELLLAIQAKLDAAAVRPQQTAAPPRPSGPGLVERWIKIALQIAFPLGVLWATGSVDAFISALSAAK